MIIHQIVPILSAAHPLVLSPDTGDVNGLAVLATCFAGIQYQPGGQEFEAAGDNSAYDQSRGSWLDIGSGDDVWIQWVRSGGTLGDWNDEDAGDARLQMTANRSWRIKRESVGFDTIIGTFNFYNASSGGSLIANTGSLTFDATVDAS